jgi:putative membrane protein
MKTSSILKVSLMSFPMVLAGSAFAQMANDTSAPSTAAVGAPSSSDMSTNASSTNRDRVAHSDRSFAAKLAESSTNEVALSQLADSHASNADVKQFAAMMVTDHTKLNSEFSDLAARKGIDISEPVMKGQKKGVAGLEKKSGADFDKAYLKDMVKGHKETAELLKKEAANSKDTDLAQFATQALPTVLTHLQKAQDLLKGM